MFSTTYLQSFFLPNPDACNLQPAVSNFAAHGHELLVQYWHTQQAVLRFMVILSLPLPNNTVQTFSGAKDSSLSRFLFKYLWSLHLVVNIVKAMFKSIFFSLIFTPCCKYTYSKNTVKFWKSTSPELRQEFLKLNRIAAASTRCFTFELFLRCELNYYCCRLDNHFLQFFM